MSRGRLFFLAVFLVVAALIAAGVVVLFTRPEIVFDVDGEALASSLAEELREERDQPVAAGTCVSRREGTWECTVDKDPGSRAIATYDVVEVDDGCWRLAEKHSSRDASARRRSEAKGCLELFDYLGIG